MLMVLVSYTATGTKTIKRQKGFKFYSIINVTRVLKNANPSSFECVHYIIPTFLLTHPLHG